MGGRAAARPRRASEPGVQYESSSAKATYGVRARSTPTLRAAAPRFSPSRTTSTSREGLPITSSGPPSSEPLSTRITGALVLGQRLEQPVPAVAGGHHDGDRAGSASDTERHRHGMGRCPAGRALVSGLQFLGEEVDEAVRVRAGVLQHDVVEAGLGVLRTASTYGAGVRADGELLADVLGPDGRERPRS